MATQLTAAQLATLKTAITNNATWNAFPNNSDGWFDLATLLNKDASPVVKAWRFIPRSAALPVIDPSELDNMFSNGGSKGFALQFQLNMLQGIDCTTVSGPRAITDLVTNTGAPNTRLGLLNTATENMTAGQQVFGGSTVLSATPPTAVSATLRNFSGKLTADDINAARNS